jgi:fumarate hydratase class II
MYKPLMIYNITHSITLMTDGCIKGDALLTVVEFQTGERSFTQ